MALRKTTVRLDPDTEASIHMAAGILGITAAEFIRTAALSRAIFTIARHRPDLTEGWDGMYDQAHAILTRLEAAND